MPTAPDALLEFNRIMRRGNAVYSDVARTCSLSDSLFWILYTLRESNEALTQSEIVSRIQLPKQTINSSLKKLLSDGLIVLKEGHRAKPIALTERGETLCAQTVDRVLAVERASFEQFTPDEQRLLLSLFERWTNDIVDRLHQLDFSQLTSKTSRKDDTSSP